MARNILNRVNLILNRINLTVEYLFGARFPSGALCTINLNEYNYTPNVTAKKSLKEIISDGFLWAVPTKRRSVEKRLNRKFGIPKYNWKPLVLKNNLIPCRTCGHYHEAQNLCNNCYTRVKNETTEMSEAIINNLGLEPVEKEVVVLYEGEKKTKPDDYWKNQRIVELPKKRPAWFHSNLLQPSTQESSESTEIKPTGLA